MLVSHIYVHVVDWIWILCLGFVSVSCSLYDATSLFFRAFLTSFRSYVRCHRRFLYRKYMFYCSTWIREIYLHEEDSYFYLISNMVAECGLSFQTFGNYAQMPGNRKNKKTLPHQEAVSAVRPWEQKKPRCGSVFSRTPPATRYPLRVLLHRHLPTVRWIRPSTNHPVFHSTLTRWLTEQSL